MYVESVSRLLIYVISTGLFLGLVIGMNLGVYWQPDIICEIPYVSLIFSPIFSGILLKSIIKRVEVHVEQGEQFPEYKYSPL